jgi:probable F420-dependent oxidoreductase
MKFGISTFVTDDGIDTVSLARAIEERGLDSLVIAEHTHIPASRESPYPQGGELPSIYYRTLDPFVTLAAAAAVTSRIELFTGIALLIQRDPIITAKEAASLDFLSGGRLDLIVGHGWNLEEMRNHGTDPEVRDDVVRERMLAIRAIWQNDEASFAGEHVSFDALWSWPKPLQPGGVPLLLGGNSPGSEERALEYGDGWAPASAPGIVERVRAFAAENPGVPVHVAGVSSDPAEIDAYAEAGASRAILGLGAAHPGETERTLEELRGSVETAVG